MLYVEIGWQLGSKLGWIIRDVYGCRLIVAVSGLFVHIQANLLIVNHFQFLC